MNCLILLLKVLIVELMSLIFSLFLSLLGKFQSKHCFKLASKQNKQAKSFLLNVLHKSIYSVVQTWKDSRHY
jgi:hypothetical protein